MHLPPPDLEWQTYGASLAYRARLLRKRRGVTQEELSELSGVSRILIQNIERGHATGKAGAPTNPSLKTLYLLSYALGVPPVVLLPDAGEEVHFRSPSVSSSPDISEIVSVDISWSTGIEFKFPDED